MIRKLPILLAAFTLACNLPFLQPRGSALPVASTLPPAFAPTQAVTASPALLPQATLDPSQNLLPDGAVVDGPSACGFDAAAEITTAGGWLCAAEQYLPSTGRTPAAQVLARVALENSVNPRLLIALLESRCHCVYGGSGEKMDETYLLGVRDERYKGFYRQFTWAAEQVNAAFYARQFGSPPLELALPNPAWNAGSAAVWYLFSRLEAAGALPPGGGEAALNEFLGVYAARFGAPWPRNAVPLLPPGLKQPELTLPFPDPAEHPWALTGGPHPPWTRVGPWAALDFAPTLRGEEACSVSPDWVLAPAAGRVARSANGALVLDLDFDGCEQSGWALLFMHIAEDGRLPVGTDVKPGARLGHPSCEGGPASGAHVHVARKYNGVWIPADGAIPFVLGGWQAHFGEKPYQGSLTNGDRTVTASPYGARGSVIP